MAFPRWSLAGLSLFILTVCSPTAHASYPLPYWSFQKPTSNGKYIFVLIGEADRSAIGGFPEPAESRDIRRNYPRSGLYFNDGSTVPIWAFEGLGRRDDVHVASDGIHMIWSEGVATSPDTTGVSFYTSGKTVRSYPVGELVGDWDRIEIAHKSGNRAMSGGTSVLWKQEGWLNNEALEYIIETKDGNRFVFDVRTGEIISLSRSGQFWQRVFWIGGMIVGFVVAGLCIRWILRRTRVPLH